MMPCALTDLDDTLDLGSTVFRLNTPCDGLQKKLHERRFTKPTTGTSSFPDIRSLSKLTSPSYVHEGQKPNGKVKKKKDKPPKKAQSKSRRRKLRASSTPVTAIERGELKHKPHPPTGEDGSRADPVRLPSLHHRGSLKMTTPLSDGQDPKKPRRAPLLLAIRPENAESEKERFMKSKARYNPVFLYKCPASDAALARFSEPSDKLIPLAEKIMRNVIKKHGTFESFIEETGGRKLSRMQIVEAAKTYLKKEGLLDEVSVSVRDDILARALMTRVRGQPTLQVRANTVREHWMEGLLRHEIGTHYLRSSNHRQQVWYKWKRRRELELLPLNPTEEGVAALHSVIFRESPSLFRSAMLYYTAYHASRLSLVELFNKLEAFIKCPEDRWDYCMRAKRGQEDTSKPGTFCKDQVYLKGALEILRHRKMIDFHSLMMCGKVAYQDVERIKPLADLETTRIPGFMEDLDLYRKKLDEIVTWNGLTNRDLEAVL